MAIKKSFDAIIVGGGASGLMCAISAMQNNRNISKIAIIEKNDRVGKKLLSTGNGRCNLTNNNISIDKYTGTFKYQAKSIFEKIDCKNLLKIFNNLGLLTFSDSEGRIYPISKQASSVLDVLRFACERYGVEVFCGENIKSVRKISEKFIVTCESSEFIADKLVIACGSKAAPKLGGNASASDYLKNFGHKLTAFSPALCPVIVKSDLLKALKGLRITGKANLFDEQGELIKSEAGEIQFTEKALSGICIFNLSLYSKKNYNISVDLLPDYSNKELFALIIKQKELFQNYTIENLFTGIFQKRITIALLKMSIIDNMTRLCGSLSEEEIKSLCYTIKNMRFKVTGNEDFTHAQSALGGVYGNEIHEKTMESKIVKNLFICGEAIDLCGECGGYNLHFAFSGGYIAGENL